MERSNTFYTYPDLLRESLRTMEVHAAHKLSVHSDTDLFVIYNFAIDFIGAHVKIQLYSMFFSILCTVSSSSNRFWHFEDSTTWKRMNQIEIRLYEITVKLSSKKELITKHATCRNIKYSFIF